MILKMKLNEFDENESFINKKCYTTFLLKAQTVLNVNMTQKTKYTDEKYIHG